MGRLFLVELDIVPPREIEHLRCRLCYPLTSRSVNVNYVALKSNRVHGSLVTAGRFYVYTYSLDGQIISEGNYSPMHFYTEVANVAFGEPMVELFFGKIRGVMANMYCNKCNTPLGWKFIESYQQRYKYMEGLYGFDRRRLDLWCDGQRGQCNYIGGEFVCM